MTVRILRSTSPGETLTLGLGCDTHDASGRNCLRQALRKRQYRRFSDGERVRDELGDNQSASVDEVKPKPFRRGRTGVRYRQPQPLTDLYRHHPGVNREIAHGVRGIEGE